MLCVDGDDDAGDFTPLVLVDGYSPSEGEFFEVEGGVFYRMVIEGDLERSHLLIDLLNLTYVSIINIFLVVILNLHDFITEDKTGRFGGLGTRIEVVLQKSV